MVKLAESRWRRTAAFLSIGLWSLSLTLPALAVDQAKGPVMMKWGYELLFGGWIGWLTGSFAWFANLAWFVTITLGVLGVRWSLVFAVLGLGLASTMFLPTELVDRGSLQVGAWIWLAAFVPPVLVELARLSPTVSAAP
jgi:hypothetical protein